MTRTTLSAKSRRRSATGEGLSAFARTSLPEKRRLRLVHVIVRVKTAGEAIKHCGSCGFERGASSQPGVAMRNLMGNRNHGSLLKKATAAGLACLLFVAGLPLPAAAEESCKDWRTAKFFESATVGQVRACLSAGRDPNERDRQRLTALHRAARDTSDPAVIEALLDAGANQRASSIAGRSAPGITRGRTARSKARPPMSASGWR